MWGLGALRDGAAGLVKQGAGAVKHGVEAGAKLLENLEEVIVALSVRKRTRSFGLPPVHTLIALHHTTLHPSLLPSLRCPRTTLPLATPFLIWCAPAVKKINSTRCNWPVT